MLDSGIFPSGLKIPKILPIFKKGDVNSLNKYRPISLLPDISKRIIYDQLDAYFDNNNILSEEQYGFRTKHSAELAAVKLVEYIKKMKLMENVLL